MVVSGCPLNPTHRCRCGTKGCEVGTRTVHAFRGRDERCPVDAVVPRPWRTRLKCLSHPVHVILLQPQSILADLGRGIRQLLMPAAFCREGRGLAAVDIPVPVSHVFAAHWAGVPVAIVARCTVELGAGHAVVVVRDGHEHANLRVSARENGGQIYPLYWFIPRQLSSLIQSIGSASRHRCGESAPDASFVPARRLHPPR